MGWINLAYGSNQCKVYCRQYIVNCYLKMDTAVGSSTHLCEYLLLLLLLLLLLMLLTLIHTNSESYLFLPLKQKL
jgi:hypothetical protein